MIFWKKLGGMVSVRLTGAEPAASLEAINSRGIRLYRVEWIDELTVRFACSSAAQKKIAALCTKRGDTVCFSDETGLLAWGRKLARRKVLVSGILLLLVLTMYLPTRVLFFRVEGNESVPARKILETAADCGIRFGVSRREIRSEKMKNALLGAMPELKWAGINTSGCTAVISVRERPMQEQQTAVTGAGSIVAVRDAFVTSCTVTRGNGLCAPGQVVKEGQVLISGYTDLGLCLQITQAQGEVYGETQREIRAVTPGFTQLRETEGKTEHRFSLILGKKRINFWKGSGISPATCGRMYKEYYMTLPGGFRLPVCLAVETRTWWETVPAAVEPDQLEQQMRSFARKQILSHMVAGSILRETMTMTHDGDVYRLNGSARCSEMIGRVMKEEIGEANGKTD